MPPCLEQHITVKLSTSSNITVKVSKSNRQLPQTNPHTTPLFHPLTRIHSYVHLSADGEIFPELYYTLQSPHSPNRELLFTRSSRTVQKIHTQTNQTSAIVDLT
jgi:hypothetical protein